MLNKDAVKLLYQQSYGYAAIAKEFGVSPQRIHQIIKNYKNFGRRDRIKKYYQLSKFCEKCNKPAVALHHKDGNNSNDEIENLLPVCKKCHGELHKGKNHNYQLVNGWSKEYSFCIKCKTTQKKHVGKGLCTKCVRYSQNKKCLDCNIVILNTSTKCQLCAIKQRFYMNRSII